MDTMTFDGRVAIVTGAGGASAAVMPSRWPAVDAPHGLRRAAGIGQSAT